MSKRLLTTAAAALFVLPAVFAGAADARAQDAGVRAKAKEVVDAYRDAVIHVKVALKMSLGGQEMDQEQELLGTVIDPSGLTVLSEAALNPAGMLGGMLPGGEESGLKSEVGDLKMVLPDGKEIAGRVVLRDKDLDLAFVTPNEKGSKFTFVPLEGGKAPEILDDVVIVSRLRRSLDRTPSVSLGRISAIVKKPRTFYVVEGVEPTKTGCPAFDASGKPLGLFLQRRAESTGGGFSGLMDMVGGMIPVILPCDDVKEGAQQALAEAAKAPPPKTEAPKPVEKKTDEPKKDAPKGEEPKKDEPKKDEK